MLIPSDDIVSFGFTNVGIYAKTTLIFIENERTHVIRNFIFVSKTTRKPVSSTENNVKFDIRTAGTEKFV